MSTRMKAVLFGTMVRELHSRLKSKLTTVYDIHVCGESTPAEELAAAIGAADVLVAMAYGRPCPPASRLKLLQVAGSGTDKIDTSLIPGAATICNAFGHDSAVGEYVTLGMLLWCHGFLEMESSFRAGSWRMSSRTGGPLHSELRGKTVGVLGLGFIGSAVAERAKALGTTVIAWNRSPRERPRFVDQLYSLGQLAELLPQCDFVVVCCALGPETMRIIDTKCLAAMRRDSVLINVARGECVDEDALYEACRCRTIAGAILDVWYAYPSPAEPNPPPSRHPFASLSNVLMTPHSAAWTTEMVDRRLTDIAGNMDRLARGEPFINVVRPGLPS